MLKMKDNYLNFNLPNGFVKAYADSNINIGYITLEEDKYYYNESNTEYDRMFFDTLQEAEYFISEVVGIMEYELSVDQYILYSRYFKKNPT